MTSLRTQIAQAFGDAQKTTATQRKLVVNLRKIQEACCFEPPETGKKGGKKGKDEAREDFDEEDFNNEVVRCVLRVLAVKKSEPVGDRVIRFLGVFLKHASEKGMRNAWRWVECTLTHGRPGHFRGRDRGRSHCVPRDTQQPSDVADPHHDSCLSGSKRQDDSFQSYPDRCTHREQPPDYRRRHLQSDKIGFPEASARQGAFSASPCHLGPG